MAKREVPVFDQSQNPEPLEKSRRVQTRVTLKIFGTEGQAYHTVQQMERWLRTELGDQVVSVVVDWVADDE